MSIEYDKRPPPKKASDTNSLLNRIEKPPLAERLNPSSKKVASLMCVSTPHSVFTSGTYGEFDRDSASLNGSVGAVHSRVMKKKVGGRPNLRREKVHKSAADLDKEIDAFMADDGIKPASAVKTGGDVEMSA